MPPHPFSPPARVSLRILLVEDEPKLRQTLVEGLSLEAWSVTGAADGAEAWRLIEAEPFDLIVLDWMLPDCDGIELIRCLREAQREVPILLITARCTPADRETALRVGATDFLAKPFSFHDLLDRARALLSAAR
jgi:DNA-binding response OmpR family regulator